VECLGKPQSHIRLHTQHKEVACHQPWYCNVNFNVSNPVSVKELRYSGLFCSEWRSFLTDVSEQPIGTIFSSQESRMGPICCSETSTRNYHYALRNSPEERSSYLLRGGSLKSRTVSASCIKKFEVQYQSWQCLTVSHNCVPNVNFILKIFWCFADLTSLSTRAPDGHLQVWRYQMLYNTILTSWWWEPQCSKHVEGYNKLLIKQEFVH